MSTRSAEGRVERVLTLDLALLTGWAFRDLREGSTRSSTVQFRRRSAAENALFYDQLASWAASKLAALRPQLVVREQPHLRGANTFHLVGAAAVLDMEVHRAGISLPTHVVHSSSVRSAVFGRHRKVYENRAKMALYRAGKSEKHIKTNWMKRAVVECMRDRGFTVRDDNEADALMMLEYVTSKITVGELGL